MKLEPIAISAKIIRRSLSVISAEKSLRTDRLALLARVREKIEALRYEPEDGDICLHDSIIDDALRAVDEVEKEVRG